MTKEKEFHFLGIHAENFTINWLNALDFKNKKQALKIYHKWIKHVRDKEKKENKQTRHYIWKKSKSVTT